MPIPIVPHNLPLQMQRSAHSKTRLRTLQSPFQTLRSNKWRLPDFKGLGFGVFGSILLIAFGPRSYQCSKKHLGELVLDQLYRPVHRTRQGLEKLCYLSCLSFCTDSQMTLSFAVAPCVERVTSTQEWPIAFSPDELDEAFFCSVTNGHLPQGANS